MSKLNKVKIPGIEYPKYISDEFIKFYNRLDKHSATIEYDIYNFFNINNINIHFTDKFTIYKFVKFINDCHAQGLYFTHIICKIECVSWKFSPLSITTELTIQFVTDSGVIFKRVLNSRTVVDDDTITWSYNEIDFTYTIDDILSMVNENLSHQYTPIDCITEEQIDGFRKGFVCGTRYRDISLEKYNVVN